MEETMKAKIEAIIRSKVVATVMWAAGQQVPDIEDYPSVTLIGQRQAAIEIAKLCAEEIAESDATLAYWIAILKRVTKANERYEKELAASEARLSAMTKLLLEVDVWLHDWADKDGPLHLPANDLRAVLRTKIKEALTTTKTAT